MAPGEVVCLIGPSGSGKSTLLRCVNLLEQPNEGTIHVGGFEATDPDVDIDKMRRKVGMVFQQFNLFPHLNALQNCTIAQTKVLKRSQAEADKVAMATWNAWAWGTWPTVSRTSSPAASSSAWRSPGR